MNIREINPPAFLEQAILLKIQNEKRKFARINVLLKSSLAFVSVIGIIPAIKFLIEDVRQSGFFEYLSLFFSDGNLVMTFWKQLMMSLAESFPILTLSISFGLVALFIWAFSGITRDARILTA